MHTYTTTTRRAVPCHDVFFSPQRAFTFIELMVVIAIIAVLLGITLPVINSMISTGGREAGVNSVAAAIKAGRAYGRRNQGAGYEGSALVFTLNKEIRITQHDPMVGGYVDVPLHDYINMAQDTGVVGMTRDTAKNGLVLYAPPFAVRYNANGRLVVADASDTGELVHYDGNYNETYEATSRPASGAPDCDNDELSAPECWTDPEVAFNDTQNLWAMPFEQLEVVRGVIVYSKGDFQDAGHTAQWDETSFAAGSRGKWLLDNGRTLLFGVTTGSLMREFQAESQ